MSDILIRTDALPNWIDEKYFKGTDLASIEDLIEIIEDLQDDLEVLQEEYDDFKQEVEDNYKFIPTEEQIGYNRATW